MKLDQPARAKFTKTFDQRNEANFRNLTLPKLDIARKKEPAPK